MVAGERVCLSWMWALARREHRQVGSLAVSVHTTRHRSVASSTESRALSVVGRGWHISGWPSCCYIDHCLVWSALVARRHYYQPPLPPVGQPGHPGLPSSSSFVRGSSYASRMSSSNAASCAYDNPIGLHVITAASVVPIYARNRHRDAGAA
jgi:hypothetical protein